MSRRKQQRPRHFESESEDLCRRLGEDITNEIPTEKDEDVTIPSPTSDNSPHLCEFCHEEFWQMEEFLDHKDNCMNNCKRRRIMFDPEPQEDSVNGEVNEHVRSAPSVSDGEENMSPEEEEEGMYPEQFQEQRGEEDFPPEKMNEDEFSEEETKDQEKENDLAISKESKAAMAAQLPQLMSLANMANILPTSNVKLEPMSGTKAAVAQFAENNNLMPNDMAVLQATLFNLQQQQIVQLQLIQQLQNQIVTTKKEEEGEDGEDEDEDDEGREEREAEEDEILSKMSETPKPSTPSEIPTTDSKPSNQESENVKSQSDKMPPTSSKGDGKNYISSLAAMNNMTYNSLPRETPIQRGSILPPHLLLTPPDEGYAQRGTVLERAQYASDDPFFKHKCRFCHKVFGSDSALQIHVRSHTGERPFKCHICGNRFSTKGNLKVHFERHKAKYPNARMNPTPVPEHLDRLPGGGMGMPINPPNIPTSMPLPPGFMNNPMMPSMGMHMGPMTPGFPMAARLPSAGLPSLHRPSLFSPNQPPVVSLPQLPSLPPAPINTHPAERQERHERPSSPEVKTEKSSPPTTPQQNREAAPTPTSTGSNLSSRASSASESLPLPTIRSPMGPRPSLHPPTQSPFPLPSPLHPMANMAASIASSMASIASSMSSPFSSITAPAPSMEPPMFKNTILPTKMIDPSENLEEYMEVSKSETSKLEQLVKNIEQKITDPNQCLICHRVLSCKSALQMHYRIHTGERPFKCKICSRSFTTKGNLKTHMGVHRAKPPLRMMHQCPVCHKQFTNLLVLQQHIRMHTGEHGMPSMMPEQMYMHPEWAAMQQFDPKMMRPYDLSQGEAKELDLSNKSMMKGDVDDGDYQGYSDDDQKLGMDLDDDDEEEEIDEEDRAAIAHENDDIERPEELKIKTDDCPESDDLPKNYSSPNNDDSPPSSRPNSAGQPQSFYSSPLLSSSTSLAALEERVKAFDSQIAQSSFERFRYNMGLGQGMPGDKTLSPNSQPPMMNGDRSPGASPKSHSASENGSEYGRDEMRPNPMMFPPGAGIPGFPMMGGMDMRPRGPDGIPHTTCNICFKTFACRSALDIHYRSHTRERPFQCDVCERTFTTRGNMRQHMLTHKIRDLPTSSFNENSDNKQSDSSAENKVEENGKENSQQSHNIPFPSSPTREKEPEKRSPESDKTNLGSNIPQSNANISNTVNTNNNNPHMVNNNSNNSDESPFARRTGSKQHLCQTCHKSFSSGSALMIHTRTHTGDKPFKCNVCGKAFTTRGNLKVHMGTHMWNNSPSRRGRRMSIEPPFMMSHMKDNPYIHGFPQRPPDFYFQYPPFFNGISPKMNDLSVLQSIQAGMGMPMHPGMAGLMPKMEPRMEEKKEEHSISANESKSPENKNLTTGSGELDLSMRSNSSGNSASASSSPQTKDSPSEGSSSPGSAAGGWLWKAGSCHICSQSFSSSAALEQHLQTHHLQSSAAETQKAIVA